MLNQRPKKQKKQNVFKKMLNNPIELHRGQSIAISNAHMVLLQVECWCKVFEKPKKEVDVIGVSK